MPEGCREGILKGIYLFNSAGDKKAKAKVQLLGSGPIFVRSFESAGDPG